MKKTILYLFSGSMLFLTVYSGSFAAPLTLHDALKANKVTCTVKGNAASTHYLEPLVLELTNLSNQTLAVTVQHGDMFIAEDTSAQNIVVTQAELITLQPNGKKTTKLKGMCTEQNDRSGGATTTYTYQPVSNEPLKKLAKFIGDKKYQSSAAQYAVWSLMDDDDINSIYSADSVEERQLKDFMAALTGKTYSVKSKDYKNNYYAPPREKVGGNFEYNFSKAQDVQIAMFDENGILVRELFNQKKVPPGEHRMSFEFDASVYTADVYYFKLIAMNEVLINRKWDIKSIRDAFKKKVEDRMQEGN